MRVVVGNERFERSDLFDYRRDIVSRPYPPFRTSASRRTGGHDPLPSFLDSFKIGRHRLGNRKHRRAVVIADPVEAEADEFQRRAISERLTERLLHGVSEHEHMLSALKASSAVCSLSGSFRAGLAQHRPKKRITLFV